MVPQSKGKIFLAEERGLTELEWFRSYNTFNFGNYYNEHKTPFGALYVLNEDILAGGRSITLNVENDSAIILIPVVGAITYQDSAGHSGTVEAGQVQVLTTPKGASIEIENPYETELVKFLQLWLKTPVQTTTLAPQLFSFDLNNNKNQLIEIFNQEQSALPITSPQYIGFIGKFAGREEAVYQITNSRNGVFAFVIEGAFEVQYRLLHGGDSLGLWELPEVELEALSNDAIILMVELPITG